VNLADDLARRFAEAPAQLGAAFESGPVLTYAELGAAIGARVRALRALGVRPADRIALVLRNGPECLLHLYACWTLGAVPVTVSALYGPRDLRSALAKATPVRAIVDAGLDEALAELRAARIPASVIGAGGDYAAEIAAQAGGPESPRALEPGAESAVLFTGGTTGEPKAVAMTHGGTLETMSKLAAASRGKPGPYPVAPPQLPPNLVLLPLFHSGGQQAMLFSYHAGRAVVLAERFRATTTAQLATLWQVDNLFLLPTMVYDLAHHPEPLELPSVRSVLVAGGAVDHELRRRFEQRFRIPILTNYGSTEIGHVAGWTAADLRAGRWKPGSAGRVYPGVDVEIRDDAGRVCSEGEDGELWVRSSLTRGYVGSDDLVVVDGWVRSGDVGHLDADRVLWLVGRKRELIKCGGFQVWPAEVEDALRSSPQVAQVAVVGAPDERLGEVPVAVVVPSPAAAGLAHAALAASLIELARAQLAHYKAIRRVIVVPNLPRTAAGKVDRAAVAAVAAQGNPAK
jgi:long-chain acyl-CoA synthetase